MDTLVLRQRLTRCGSGDYRIRQSTDHGITVELFTLWGYYDDASSSRLPMLSNNASTAVVRFGVFDLDLHTAELRKSGVRIRLQEQPFQILAMLLKRPGEAVSREELRKKLWAEETFVDFDHGLNTAVQRLREALGDTAENPRFIETLPRRGYRFIGSLSEPSTSKAEPAPRLAERVIEQKSSAASKEVVTEVPAASRAHRRWMLWATVVALVGLLLLLVALDAGRWREKLLSRTTPVHIRSIAVLPLENLSGDPAQEYFTDGMTDALVTDLAQISSLRVISRTSVMRYKGTRKPLPEIAKELNVDGIVEGAVIRSGERVRVDAQLIDASTDRHFWARTYERNLGDVIALQNEVARAIADEIQVKLTPQEHARLLRTESVDPQAYELYIQGRYLWAKRTDIQKSIYYFEQAIQRQPNYALAYAAMAEAYLVGGGGDLPPNHGPENRRRAKAAALTALQMDETVAEAHTALAACLVCDWDFAGAEKEFQRAIALNPNYAWAHQWYGMYLTYMGRKEFAAAELKRAHELDPLSLVIAWSGGGKSGYDGIIEANLKKLELDPNFAQAHYMLGRMYTLKGMYPEAIAHLQKAVDLSGKAPGYLSALGYTYAVSGQRGKALQILHQLTVLSKRRYVSPYDIALVYAGLGEKDLAFEWLQKAVAERDCALRWLKVREEQELALLRSDPRYAELKRQIGLPP